MNVQHCPQELDYSCTPACVRMVLAYHGKHRSEADLRKLLKTRVFGTSPANLMLRLPDIGFSASVFNASQHVLQQYVANDLPCIVNVWTAPLPYWNAEVMHALVVTAINDDVVSVHDPVLNDGPTAIPIQDFMAAWASTGHTLIVIEPAA